MLLTAAATIAPRRPKSQRPPAPCPLGGQQAPWGRCWQKTFVGGHPRVNRWLFFCILCWLQCHGGRSGIRRGALQRNGRLAHPALIYPPRILSVGAYAALPELRGIGGIGGHGGWLCCELCALTFLFYDKTLPGPTRRAYRGSAESSLQRENESVAIPAHTCRIKGDKG